MSRHAFRSKVLCTGCWILASLICTPVMAVGASPAAKTGESATDSEALEKDVTQGALRVKQKDGSVVECPLKHTDVRADVSGFIARVNVTQTFQNPTDEPIEAVYVFPLPHKAAVDNMTMVIGDRKIVGIIKRRGEARRIYEQALMQGQTAALLEQERPNIFTQSVGNIGPGQEVRIEISYVDVLKYDVQEYEFYFPMVVGPRFMPGQPSGLTNPNPQELQGKVSPPVANTTRVPDAERISPPVLRPGVRNGHDITVTLSIDAGVPIENLTVANHEADVQRSGNRSALVKLSPADSVPNKDFVVRYDVVGEEPAMALLAHTGHYSKDVSRLGQGYFMLMIQPKEDERLRKSPPREITFLVDVSGSMRGDKTAKTVDAMKQMLGICREIDTVQVITFASRTTKLFNQPLPVNEASIHKALHFADQIRGSGGTHMLEGVKLAIDEPIDPERVRIVVMLTDGFIGNEAEIIEHVGKNCGDHVRFWAVGIGQSPNMFLVDGVARQGGGMGKRLGLNDETELLATEIMTRIQRAQLANIKIDWGNSSVVETYPTRIPELWAGRPVIVYGRFSGSGQHQIAVSGTIEGEAARWPLSIDLPVSQPDNDVLAKVWARQRIEDLMQQAYYADSPAIEEEVTGIALDYKLMSQYTSFVAVDASQSEVQAPVARPPRRMLVPVPLPEGAQWEGFFGGYADGENNDMYGAYYSREATRFSYFEAKAPAASLAGSRGVSLAEGAPSPRPLAMRPSVPFDSFRRLSARKESVVRLQPLSLGSVVAGGARPSGAGPGGRMGRAYGIGAGLGGMASGADFGMDGVHPAWRLPALGFKVDGPRGVGKAQDALKAFEESRKTDDKPADRPALVRALFIARAMTNFGQPDGGIAQLALDRLTEMHEAQVAKWQKTTPALARRLDLVLRDQTIAESLRQIAAAAAIEIDLVNESVDDVQRLLGSPARVSYLDLRGASVAEALDWVLQPVRLTWQLSDGKVHAGSQRRLPGDSAWVYDVSRLAIPSDEEMKDVEDANKIAEIVMAATSQFLEAVRKEFKVGEDDSVVWFGPGQLLVFGDHERHAQVQKLLDELGDPSSQNKLEGELGAVQLIAHKRVAASEEAAAKRAAARRQSQVAQSHAVFGWQLLAGAVKGQVDDEAVTEMTLAWRSRATTELLESDARPLVMRSLWMLTEASRAMSGNEQIADLAAVAMKQARPFIDDMREALEKTPTDVSTYYGLLYASLALPSDDELRDGCTALLMSASKGQVALNAARLTAESLLKSIEVDAASLTSALTNQASADALVLAAMACRAAGPAAWQTYRVASRDLLRKTPVPGSVVVLINSL